MSEHLPNTEETVEQSLRRFAEQKFRRAGLVESVAQLEAIADRAAELEAELAVYKRALENIVPLDVERRVYLQQAANQIEELASENA